MCAICLPVPVLFNRTCVAGRLVCIRSWGCVEAAEAAELCIAVVVVVVVVAAAAVVEIAYYTVVAAERSKEAEAVVL